MKTVIFLYTILAATVVARDVPFVPTPQPVVDKMLALAEVGPSDVVYDLGSGDGRLVISAVRDRKARRGVGIDIDPERIRESNANARQAGVNEQVTFREGNIFAEKFDEATVVTMYLLTSVNRRLRPRLLADLEPGTRLVSHAFDMGDWKPDVHETVDVEGRTYHVYFWRVPVNASGTWTVGGEKSKHELKVIQDFQKLTGTLDGQPINDGLVRGRSITFRVPIDGGEATFSGEIQGNTLQGMLETTGGNRKWQASRADGTEQPLDGEGESQAASGRWIPHG